MQIGHRSRLAGKGRARARAAARCAFRACAHTFSPGALQVFSIVFILVKRQIRRVTQNNKPVRHVPAGTGAPKASVGAGAYSAAEGSFGSQYFFVCVLVLYKEPACAVIKSAPAVQLRACLLCN